MRDITGKLRLPSLLAAAAAIGLFAVGSASAGGHYRERIYADSFGNLIVYSPSGYKRIVVGKGYLAAELAATQGASEEPDVVYDDEDRAEYGHAYRRGCHRLPGRVVGRSYMYGLPENVVPVIGVCE
jgi:hypothetical protein